MTTDTWTIAVTVGTEDYDDILFQVSNLFKYLKGLETSSNSTDIKFLIPSFELIRLQSKLKSTQNQVDNLKLLLPTSRTKRV